MIQYTNIKLKEFQITHSQSLKTYILYTKGTYYKESDDEYYREIPEKSKRRRNDYDNDQLPPQKKELKKFANQKYFIFSKFDLGLRFDEQNWFSITPEPISMFMATFLNNLSKVVMVDGCCGNGGNLIQFARHNSVIKSYGIDIDPEKIKNAEFNARKYKFSEKLTIHQNIECIACPFSQFEM